MTNQTSNPTPEQVLASIKARLPEIPTADMSRTERDRSRLIAALESVMALAEKWRYKGEFGWGAWQEGHGPDETGAALDHAAGELRAALFEALETTMEDDQ